MVGPLTSIMGRGTTQKKGHAKLDSKWEHRLTMTYKTAQTASVILDNVLEHE